MAASLPASQKARSARAVEQWASPAGEAGARLGAPADLGPSTQQGSAARGGRLFAAMAALRLSALCPASAPALDGQAVRLIPLDQRLPLPGWATLPELARTCLELRERERLSVGAIASLVGAPPEQVRDWLFEAREHLRRAGRSRE